MSISHTRRPASMISRSPRQNARGLFVPVWTRYVRTRSSLRTRTVVRPLTASRSTAGLPSNSSSPGACTDHPGNPVSGSLNLAAIADPPARAAALIVSQTRNRLVRLRWSIAGRGAELSAADLVQLARSGVPSRRRDAAPTTSGGTMSPLLNASRGGSSPRVTNSVPACPTEELIEHQLGRSLFGEVAQ
jgi:hypothetical protein